MLPLPLTKYQARVGIPAVVIILITLAFFLRIHEAPAYTLRSAALSIYAMGSSPPVVPALVLVSMGLNSSIEGTVTIKSALMYSSSPLDFHVICDEPALEYYRETLALLHSPRHDVRVSFYLVAPEAVSARAERGRIGATHYKGVGLITKVFLHELLVNVPKVAYVDTDAAFVADPVLLWQEFDKFQRGQVMAFPTLGPDSEGWAVCSCVMLLDLEKMRRDHQWVESSLRPDASKQDIARSSLEGCMDPQFPAWGDQGVYFCIFKAHPELIGHLTVSWNMSPCRNSYHLHLGNDRETEEEQAEYQFLMGAPEPQPLFPGILHFNCLGDPYNVWEDEGVLNHRQWGPLVQVVSKYKWIWLNRGDGSTSVSTKIIRDMKFYDELHPEPGGALHPALAGQETVA